MNLVVYVVASGVLLYNDTFSLHAFVFRMHACCFVCVHADVCYMEC